MGDVVKEVRDAIEAATVRAEVAECAIALNVNSRLWAFSPAELRAFLDATKPAEPKPSELLDKLADDMIEARRYVRVNHPRTQEIVGEIRRRLFAGSDRFSDHNTRIRDNLSTGLACILSDPGVLDGYLCGAASEVRGWADARRKEGE